MKSKQERQNEFGELMKFDVLEQELKETRKAHKDTADLMDVYRSQLFDILIDYPLSGFNKSSMKIQSGGIAESQILKKLKGKTITFAQWEFLSDLFPHIKSELWPQVIPSSEVGKIKKKRKRHGRMIRI